MKINKSKSTRSLSSKLFCAACLILFVTACGGNGSSNAGGGNEEDICPSDEARCEARDNF